MHRFLLFFVLAWAYFVVVTAAPSSERWKPVVHERRTVPPHGWTKRSRLAPEARIPVRIALKQSNLHKLDAYLMDVSDPESEKYGRHWSQDEIARAFAPSRSTVEAVMEWLINAGVGRRRIRTSANQGWVSFNASAGEAELLLKTEYHVWEHEEAGVEHIACQDYWVPEHVQHHIDFITPTVHFDARIDPSSIDASKNKKRNSAVGFGPNGEPSKPNNPKIAPCPRPPPINPSLDDCSNNITPDCLRALYGIPTLNINTKRNANNSFGIVQYTPQSYVTTDLEMFFTNYSKTQVQKIPTLHSVDGGNVYDTPDMSENIESDLDLEYAMALVNPLNVTLYQVGDLIETDYTSFNNFLDALDASYCASENETASTGPIIDAIYPDPLPGGYTGPRNCGGYRAAKVISTSYSYNEHDLTPAYEARQCNEYAKLGLAGTTFLYCSGDYGVAGSLGRCVDPSTGDFGGTTSGLFAPSFPSTCPYVLSVGATQIPVNGTVNTPEIACATQISSGGGFSNIFSMPGYQASAVRKWFKNYPTSFGSERYNNSGVMRGYPDISANGAKYVVALDGSYNYRLYGTSAATPVVAAMITLLNEARLNAGRGSIGFINPTLYANPWLLNDITNGTNPGCGTEGFSAAPGWDPVTGLGTPNYPRMLQYFLTH